MSSGSAHSVIAKTSKAAANDDLITAMANKLSRRLAGVIVLTLSDPDYSLLNLDDCGFRAGSKLM